MLYVAAEVGFGNWIYTYAIEQGLADEVTSGYLTSAYWGAYTVGRLASVVVSARIRPRLLLSAALGTAGTSVLLLWVIPASGAVTWVCTMVFGVALAPMFPVMVTFAGERTMITGGVTSLFLVGASLGAMSLPWLIGQAFGPYGPTVVPALVLIDILLLIGVFSIVTFRYANASAT
jgi:FHS family Na+ dependent glucose MFS transporter 1